MGPQQNRPHETAAKRRSHAREWSDHPRNRHAATHQVVFLQPRYATRKGR